MTNTPTGGDWAEYYDLREASPPRDTLLRAADLFDAEPPPARPRRAVDLGCGTGNDTLELLRRGWHVHAVDAHPEGIARLIRTVPPDVAERLTTEVAAFEQLEIPRADLVNASYSLPFASPAAFPRIWERVVDAIEPGGRFAGQLFGVRDQWASIEGMTFQTREQVESLFAPFDIEYLQEIEELGSIADGSPKQWHLFHVVARRR